MLAIGRCQIDKKGKKEKLTYRIRNSVKIDIKITLTHIPQDFLKFWDENNQQFKINKKNLFTDEISTTNKQLYDFSIEISKLMCSENSSTIKFSTSWLKEKYQDFFNLTQKDLIIVQENNDPEFKIFYNEYISQNIQLEDRNNGKNLKPNSIKGYKTMFNYWIKFTDSQNMKDYKLSEINLIIFDKFIQLQENKYQLDKKSIETNINKFNALLNHAYKKNKNVSHDYISGNFKYTGELTNQIYLNEDEIEQIIELKLSEENNHLENSRLWFLIQLFSGLRISDLFLLNEEYIKDGFIEIITTKTNTQCIIPLFNPIKKILEKNSGKFPEAIPEPIYNKNIKEISKLAGITTSVKGSLSQKVKINNKEYIRKKKGEYPKYKLVTSHTCRRSLFTNLSKKDISLNNITSLSGHSNIRTLENYIQTSIHEKSKAIKDKLASMEGFY
ncbi:tyrosine-type recombinase/integrase [Empedobacter sp.]|uniref:tyrosine-type recombinase/integrase n=1 Tax=Empedobacter sp. TaxID=1927715 RepID=UPI0028B1B4BC|nr:tyrosine-type recombinase/integrase [Empedobacter sp.]